ncbi:FtsX-like permease family protein [Chloroflexota bacterium]
MSLFFSEWHLIFKRTLANWRLLSTLMVGVLVAVALLSSTPLYSNAINDLGLKRALNESQPELLDLQVFVPYDIVNYQNYNEAGEFVNKQVSRNISQVIRQEETWIKTQNYYAGWEDRPIPDGQMRPTGYFQVFSNLKEHITITEGKYAEPITAAISGEKPDNPDFAVEGMIGSETAELFKVGVGDRLIFITGYGSDERQIRIELTAIIDPIDITEEYWLLKTDVFTAPSEDGEVAPIFIPEQTLFEGVARIIPATKASYHWFYFIDIEKISSQNAGTIDGAVNRMERQLLTNLPRSGMLTIVNSVISQYQDKLMYTQIPLFLIVSQIVVIILYYLVTVSNMLIERQAGEIALFRSRGASTRQITSIYLMEGLLITIIGAAVGPFLGAFVFSLLGTTGSFYALTGGGFLPIRFSGTVIILAAAAAVLCLLTILVPAIQAARRGVVHQRQQAARPAAAPFWQRFYLDLVILVFGGVLYWELKERGSLLTMDMFGGMNVDPILLITPMLILIAVAIIFLRLFPIIIRILTKLGTYIGNAPVLLSLWHMARNPVHYGRLILLLIMAASVGMFSATFLGTLERSYNERVMYTAGGDVRLEGLYDWNSSSKVLQQRYSELPGVEDVSLAYRVNGRIGTMFTETEFNLLAVDAGNLSKIAWYRDDFADKSLPLLLEPIAEDESLEQGLDLPEDTERLGLWVYPKEGSPMLKVYARVKDGIGHYRDHEIGTTNTSGWQYIEAKLTKVGTDTPSPPPLNLVCIYVTLEGRTMYWQSPGGLYFDNLQVRSSVSAEPVVVEDFEDIGEWTMMMSDTSSSLSMGSTGTDILSSDSEVVHNGDYSAQISWMHRRGYVKKGIFVNIDSSPLVAIASNSFLKSAKVSVGDEITIRVPGEFIPVIIEEAADYFPTLDPAKKGFMIVNLNRFLSPRNTIDSRISNPNEVWLNVTSDAEQRSATLDRLSRGNYGGRDLYDKEEMLAELKSDPLAGAGWGGMLIIAFLGVVIVSSLGFIVYNYLSAQSRQLDFTILRTLGFSLGQIIGLVCFEQLFIVFAGMGIGTFIGGRLSYVMLPFLQLTEKGERVLPPFILTVDWLTIGVAYAIIAIAFIITISMVIMFFYRAAIHQALRMGDV